MKLDHEKFNNLFIGDKKRALNLMIDNAKSGVWLAWVKENTKTTLFWAERWQMATVYLRTVNQMQSFSQKCETIEQMIEEFSGRVTKAEQKGEKGAEQVRANEFAVQMLKDHKDTLKKKKVA